MKYNFINPILDLDGNLIPKPGTTPAEDPKDHTPWPMWEAVVAGVIAPPAKAISYDESFRRYKIASDVRAKPKDVELDARDVQLVKECVAAVFGPVVVGPVGKKLESAKA